MAIIGKVEILEGESVPLLSRVRAYDGGYLQQADVSSIAYTVADLDDPETSTAPGSLAAGDVVFDTLQTGDLWTEDSTGYNFSWTPDASLLPGAAIAGGTKVYRVEVKITPTASSNKIMLVWIIEVLNTYSGSAGVSDPEAYSGIGYCTRMDMESMFGRDNISKWADMENTEDPQLGFTRVSRSIVVATAEIDDSLRKGPYVLPFAVPPTTIVNLAAALAGVWLYESRGIEDFDDATGRPIHRLSAHKDMALRILSDLRANTRTIDAPTTSRSGVDSPFIVPG
jgi:phage gp36-like protein